MTPPNQPPAPPDPVSDHRRQWRHCRYVYPVVSRRAKGLSVGVNLNPDKRCNFGCRYCQINRRIRRAAFAIDLLVLAEELRLALSAARSGQLWDEATFARTPPAMRRVNDIAFSGDGEPTCVPNFDQAVAAAAAVKAACDLPEVKLVVITNASALDQPPMQRALPILDDNAGEIWAKLDAGTEAYFRRINRPAGGITLARVVAGITDVARGRPVVIQTLLPRWLDTPGGTSCPPLDDAEIDAYITRLAEIRDAGGAIRLVQLHTVARPPAEADVAALAVETLDEVAARIRDALPDTPVEVYPGRSVPPQS